MIYAYIRAFHFAEDPLGRVRAPFARHPHVEDSRVGLNAPHRKARQKGRANGENVGNTLYIAIQKSDMVRYSCTCTTYIDSLTWSAWNEPGDTTTVSSSTNTQKCSEMPYVVDRNTAFWYIPYVASDFTPLRTPPANLQGAKASTGES